MFASNAYAQSPLPKLQLAPELAVSRVPLLTAEAEREQLVAVRRARLLTTIGIGVVLGAFATTALLYSGDCAFEEETLWVPGLAGGVVGALGVTVSTYGIVKLNGIDIDFRKRHLSSAAAIGMVVGGAAFAALGALTVILPSIPQWIGCVSS